MVDLYYENEKEKILKIFKEIDIIKEKNPSEMDYIVIKLQEISLELKDTLNIIKDIKNKNYVKKYVDNEFERRDKIYDLIAEKREVENIINTKQINREISSYAFGYTFFRLAELKYGEDVYRMALNKEKITLA